MLERGFRTLRRFCIEGITANEERCRALVDTSIGVVTALLPWIGYAAATEVARKAQLTGIPVRDIVREMGLLTDQELEDLLQPERMVAPVRLSGDRG